MRNFNGSTPFPGFMSTQMQIYIQKYSRLKSVYCIIYKFIASFTNYARGLMKSHKLWNVVTIYFWWMHYSTNAYVLQDAGME